MSGPVSCVPALLIAGDSAITGPRKACKAALQGNELLYWVALEQFWVTCGFSELPSVTNLSVTNFTHLSAQQT